MFLYALLFLLVLCGLCVSRLALLSMTTSIGRFEAMLDNITASEGKSVATVNVTSLPQSTVQVCLKFL